MSVVAEDNSIFKMEYPEKAHAYLTEILAGKREFDLKNHGEDLVFSTFLFLGRSALAHYNFDELIIQLLERGLDPNMQDKNGQSLLSCAVTAESIPLVKYLVSRKVPLNNLCSTTGRGIIHHLVHFSYGKENEILEFLLNAGLDPNLPDANGIHPLAYLIDHLFTPEQMKQKAKILLRYKFEVNHVTPKGTTFLDYGDDNIDYGWDFGTIPTLKCLLVEANVTHVVNPKSGVTAFHKAAKYGLYEMLILLAGNTPETDLKVVMDSASKEMANIGKFSSDRNRVFGACTIIDSFSEDDKSHQKWLNVVHHQVKEVISLLAQLGASTQSIETAQKTCAEEIKQLHENLEKESLHFRINDMQVQIEFIKFIQDNLISALKFSKERTEQQIKTKHQCCILSNRQWRLKEAKSEQDQKNQSELRKGTEAEANNPTPAKVVILSAQSSKAGGLRTSAPVITTNNISCRT